MSKPRSTSIHLDIPCKSTEVEDPGAHDLSSDDEFQDATEGRKRVSRPVTPSSPIPITRVEKVDDEPRHGEVPGTAAWDKRRQDAVPDEIEVVPEGTLSKRSSRQLLDPPLTPGGTPIPRTVVEKLNPDDTSYGEEPGTPAYKKRMTDATPDFVLKNPDPSQGSKFKDNSSHSRNTSTASIPATVVTRADNELAHGEVPGTAAAELRKKDATPDKMEIESDVSVESEGGNNEENDFNDNDGNGFGEDFDDFEEGDQAGADDDFGDFDEVEQEAPNDSSSTDPNQHAETRTEAPSFPLINFDALSDLPDLLETTRLHLDAMFPTTTSPSETTIDSDSIPLHSPIFPTDRSRSLWKQLITPPPLQPPNWTQSRIRRLFLISLGVPVDLDEILPPSKQKKLILPDIELPSRTSTTNDDSPVAGKPENDSITKLRSTKTNDSSASIDSQQSVSTAKRGRERPKSMKPGQLPAPPPLDLNAVKRLCATTNEKLEGFTDDELQAHVKELGSLTEKTSLVLEYWLKKKDGLRKEKEAFEGVIENLVRHAKRVRTFK
ncbi:hypothetical protein LTS08_001711 [Lithohypha guttulata]|nr:hypothetical protein LTS08_001711 [Lithohypha guttulata]